MDGNDFLAVYGATKEARERAVAGLGATFIEAVTYRFGPHTTADDPTKYREDAEVEEWRKFDPLLRLQKYLQGKGLWSEETENKFKAEGEAIVSRAVQDAESAPPPHPEAMFRTMFAELTPILKEQMDDYLAFIKENE